MRKDNKKFGWILASLFALLITGCNDSKDSSSQIATSSNNKDSSSQVTSSNKINSSSSSDSSSKIDNSFIGDGSSNTSSNSSKEEVEVEVSILNKIDLTKAWPINKGDRVIEIAINEGENAYLALQNDEIVISSSDENVVKVYGVYLRPVAVGSTTIKVKYKNVIDTVDVVVSASELTAPVFMFDYDGVTEFKTVEERGIKLPDFVCYDKNLNDISSNVVVTSDKDPNATYNFDTGEFTSNVIATHTVTFTAVDPDDNTVKTTRSFTIGVYKKYLKVAGDWTVGNEFKDDNSQYVTTTNTGYSMCQLNYNESSYYYIETEVVMPSNHHGGHHIGLANFKSSDTSKMYVCDIDLGDFNWKMKNFVTSGTGSWSLEGEIDNWRLGEYFEKSLPTDNTVKLAVARYNEFFYFFVDNQYVAMSTDSEYFNIPTYPGLFAHAGSSGSKFTNISYLSGEEDTMNKINELTDNGKDYFTGYVARGYEWALGSKNTNNKNFTANSYSKDRGLNFDFTNGSTGHNSGMVSLYQYFDGDFTFEFDYVPTTETTPTSNDCKMWLEARPYAFSDEIFWIGTKFRTSDAEQMIKRIKTEETGETWNTSTITNPRAGMHYKVTRRIDEAAGKCYFDLIITSLADPTQVVEKLNVPYSGTCYNDRLILIWHNTNLTGQFSNITWSTDVSTEGGVA